MSSSSSATSGGRVFAKGSSSTSFSVQQRKPSATRLQALDNPPAKPLLAKSTTSTTSTTTTTSATAPASSSDDFKQFVQTLDSKERKTTPLTALRKSASGSTDAATKKPDSAPVGSAKSLSGSLRTTAPATEKAPPVRPAKAFDASEEARPQPTMAKAGTSDSGSTSLKKGYGAAPAVRPKPNAQPTTTQPQPPSQQEKRTPKKPETALTTTASTSPKAQRDLAAALLENWPKPSAEVDAFLNGAKMEPPFSGEYYRHTPTSGYYACVRCAAPLFGASSKVIVEGGYAAFQRGNARALDVQLRIAPDGEETAYHLRCVKCAAFIGKLTQETVNATTTSGEIYRVNSQSLRYIDAIYRVRDTTVEEGAAGGGDGGGDDGGDTSDLDGLTRDEFEAQQARIAAWGKGTRPSGAAAAAPGRSTRGADDDGSGSDEESDDEEHTEDDGSGGDE